MEIMEKQFSQIKQNLCEIQENIARAAKKSGRKAEDIMLLGVTKTIPVEGIQAALDLGITHFGENKVQEFLPKYEALGNSPLWHMIGHLQTNKVKFIMGKVRLIHSVDNIRLAEEINKRAIQAGCIMDILIEINIADEDTKHGVLLEEVRGLIEQIAKFPNICIKGLMCIAPFVEDEEQNRVHFGKMRETFIDIRNQRIYNTDMVYLSMGMSNDYCTAIEEGANIIRIGTSLFGARG